MNSEEKRIWKGTPLTDLKYKPHIVQEELRKNV
jgi:hypothetical protein